MNRLNLPSFTTKISGTPDKPTIYDVLRSKFVALTPEEWVRQHFVHFLIHHKQYPQTLLANEIQLKVGEKRLRADTVLYHRDLSPQMIIEYKAPNIAITQQVFDQIFAYNLLLHTDYLVVSNGMAHFCCKMDYDQQAYRFLQDIPPYSELCSK